MGRSRGAALSDSGGQTRTTLRALPGVPIAVPQAPLITPDLRERLHQYGIAATFTKPIDISFLADELQRSLSPTTVGRMAGITLFGFLQLIEVEQKTGLIVVRAASEEGRIYFDHGRPVHAETRLAHGPAAVYEIVRWTDPKLEIFYKRTPRERTIKESLQHILMEAARLLDESGPGAPARDGGGTHQEAATPVEPRRPEVQAALAEAMTMDGALGIALIDAANGLSLGTAGGSPMVNLDLAGAASAPPPVGSGEGTDDGGGSGDAAVQRLRLALPLIEHQAR